MAEAADVEAHWRGKLQPALQRGFNVARDHFLIHGGLRALHAAEPDCALPEGYTAKVKSLRFQMLGRAAALTGGLAADGRVDLYFSAAGPNPLVLGRHFAFRLGAPTLEPVARKGDILLVREMGEPSPKVPRRGPVRRSRRRAPLRDSRQSQRHCGPNGPRDQSPPNRAADCGEKAHSRATQDYWCALRSQPEPDRLGGGSR